MNGLQTGSLLFSLSRALVVALCFGLRLGTPAHAAETTTVRLLLDSEVARPGQTVMAAVDIQLRPGWHTYWRNGGESGDAPKISWALPVGVTAGEILWPIPEKDVEEGLTTYVLNREAVLLVPLTISADAATGGRELKAKVTWLECEKQCVQKSGELVARLNVGAEGNRSPDAERIASWQRRLPQSADPDFVRARWDGAAGKAGTRTLVLEAPAASGAQRAEFFPDKSDNFEVKAQTESSFAGGRLRIRKPVEKSKDAGWPTAVSGLFVFYDAAGKATQALELKLPIASERAGALRSSSVSAVEVSLPIASERAAPRPATAGQVSVGTMLLFAFIGGLILNIMPCVLPVIALKVLGFVRQSGESPARVRKLGLVYALGVMCSFLVLAGIVIGVQAAGKQASWGMQFGNPVFVVAMTTLVTLIALNLFGVFEVTLAGGAMTTASSLASKEGAGGAFCNGVFATLLATPCTAPFLGAAVGWAFVNSANSPGLTVLTFLVIALGLALPYVLLTSFPALMRLLPRPGAWMEHFKVAMGFPMLGTAVWLFTIAMDHFGDRILWLGVFLVLVALAAWVFGSFYQRGTERRTSGLILAVLVLAGGYVFVLEGQLHWRRSQPASARLDGAAEEGGIAWRPWSEQAVEAARREGKVAFVDFTAKWCTTCQANKRTSIEIPSVREKLKTLDAVALLGDYTLVPDDMTRELKKFERAGVPLVLVYPQDATKPPKVLPELLTPSIVLTALDEAVQK